jgi:hypothetical protein
MSQEHGLTLLDSEMEDICQAVLKMKPGGSLKPVVQPRKYYNGGLEDYQIKKGWRGSIECRGEGKSEIVAWVYGPTLKIMRERKWAMVEALRTLPQNNELSSERAAEPQKQTGADARRLLK